MSRHSHAQQHLFASVLTPVSANTRSVPLQISSLGVKPIFDALNDNRDTIFLTRLTSKQVARVPLPPPGLHALPTPVSTFAFDTLQELLWAGNDYVRTNPHDYMDIYIYDHTYKHFTLH